MQVVMVAVHDSASSRHALRWAGERAASLDAELHVVTVVPTPMPVSSPAGSAMFFPNREQLIASTFTLQCSMIDESLDECPVRPMLTNTVEVGDPFRVLRRVSTRADLLVLGSPRRRGVRSLPGRCLKRLECPVVVVAEDHPC